MSDTKLNLFAIRFVHMLQTLAKLVHFIAYFTHKCIPIGRDAVIAAVDFFQQAERLVSKHGSANKARMNEKSKCNNEMQNSCVNLAVLEPVYFAV